MTRELVAAAKARPAQQWVAGTAVAAATERVGPSVCARVDLVDDDHSRPQLLELEVVEPSLFLDTATGLAQASLPRLPSASSVRPERVKIERDPGPSRRPSRPEKRPEAQASERILGSHRWCSSSRPHESDVGPCQNGTRLEGFWRRLPWAEGCVPEPRPWLSRYVRSSSGDICSGFLGMGTSVRFRPLRPRARHPSGPPGLHPPQVRTLAGDVTLKIAHRWALISSMGADLAIT